MAQDNLLRDAIMEAKQVKAAAIASAKIALEEAFQPHLQSMLSRQLRMEAVPNSSSDIGTGNNKEPSSSAKDSSGIPNPAQEVEPMGQGTSGADPKIGGSRKAANNETDAHPVTLREANPFDPQGQEEEEEDGSEESGEFAGIGANQEPGALDGMEEPEGGDEMGMDMSMGGEGGEGEELEQKLDVLIDLLTQLKAELDGDVTGGAEMGMSPEEDESFAPPMYETNLAGTPNEQLPFGKNSKGIDTKIGGSVRAPDSGDGLDSDGTEKGVVHKESKETVEEDTVNLEEILREMDVEENVQDQGTKAGYYAEVEKIMSENANLKRSLKEHRDVVRFLKDRINEINMLNAKLLFTNKLFKQFDLNAGQKMRVVENFDRATTLREVKLIFATLAEAYIAKNSATTKKIRSITEGIASKATGSTKPKNPQVLNETDSVVARFKQLAHIL